MQKVPSSFLYPEINKTISVLMRLLFGETERLPLYMRKEKRSLGISFAMVAMSRTAKSAIFYSVIGIAAGIGIMLLVVDGQTLREIFQPLVGQSSDNTQGDNSLAFAIRANYNSTLAVGEEGEFIGTARGGKEPYKFEWKFSDGPTLTGQNVTRSFDAPSRYHIELTVTDADGKQVKTTNLSTNVLQELQPRVDGTANTTSILQHN